MFATINAVSVFSFSFSFSSGVWTQLWLYTNTMHEVKWQGSSLKPFKLMEVTASNHRRSMSDPAKRKFEEKPSSILKASHRLGLDMGQFRSSVEAKKQSPRAEAQNSLKQEILQLQKGLQDQFLVRHALEKALGYRSFSHDTINANSVPKPAENLIKEIAVLELEVVYLEQYLLSLYRKTFDRQISSVSTVDDRIKSTSTAHKRMFQEVSGDKIISKTENSVIHSSHLLSPRDSIDNPPKECNDIWGPHKLLDSSIHRSHSSLSQRSTCPIRTSPSMQTLAKAVDSYHSLPLSMLERADNAPSNAISLAEHLGTNICDHDPMTPNRLSEEMIKCISAIYCRLADPPLSNNDYPSSPISSPLSMNEFSPRGQCDMWSPQCRKNSSFNSVLDNPFHIEESKEFSGPYCTMVEVKWICRDSQKLRDIEPMLQKFRSLVYQLEQVDPRKMRHEEKLAFWINVHNALIMHAFLVYGIPQNNLKRISLLLKAAYNVGGHTISVDMIQNSILGCRLARPGQWLWSLFSSTKKFKARDERKAYGIEHPEPLLHFALCSGSHSDPSARIYTPKNVFQELEVAKEEYIRTTFRLHKGQKVLLPKLVESFSKESGLCQADLVEIIEHCMPNSLGKGIHWGQHGKFWKSIEWTPHNFAFRYLLSRELPK
ncbi:hypothetical protein AAG906_037659 [Vitis piasezkii]